MGERHVGGTCHPPSQKTAKISQEPNQPTNDCRKKVLSAYGGHHYCCGLCRDWFRNLGTGQITLLFAEQINDIIQVLQRGRNHYFCRVEEGYYHFFISVCILSGFSKVADLSWLSDEPGFLRVTLRQQEQTGTELPWQMPVNQRKRKTKFWS